MSSEERLARLLEECLAGFEAGLSPEECLAAFPADREALAPLLRRALQLRVAFTAAPAEAFKLRTRERLLFAAGRDVSAAFAQDPSEAFTARARRRLLQAAGASAQEALRAVPPPRLPFWVNARRRLLEAAAMGARPAVRPMALALRAGLSVAVVVLTIAALGLAYVTLQSSTPASADELDILLQETDALKAKVIAGEKVDVTVVLELTERASNLASKVSPEMSDKLQQLKEEQTELVQAVEKQVGEEELPVLAEAKQNLAETETKITALVTQASATPLAVATEPPTVAAASPPVSTATPRPEPTSIVLGAGQIYFSAEPGDDTAGLTWRRAQTLTATFLLPGSWKASMAIDEDGVFRYDIVVLLVEAPDGRVSLIINVETGSITALVDGSQQIRVRGSGARGEVAEEQGLLEALGAQGAIVYHVAESMEVALPPTPTPTPKPSATPSAP